MSTTSSEVKTAIETAVAVDEKNFEQRIHTLEVDAKTWYEKHLPLLACIAGLVVGALVGHYIL